MGRINAIEAGVIIIFRWQSSVTWIITVPIISSISCRVLVNRKFSFFFSLLQGDFATHRQRVTDDSLHRPIFFVVDWTIFFSSNIFVLFFFFPLSAVLLNIKPSWKLRKAILVLFDGLTFCLYLLAKKKIITWTLTYSQPLDYVTFLISKIFWNAEKWSDVLYPLEENKSQCTF